MKIKRFFLRILYWLRTQRPEEHVWLWEEWVPKSKYYERLITFYKTQIYFLTLSDDDLKKMHGGDDVVFTFDKQKAIRDCRDILNRLIVESEFYRLRRERNF